MSTSDLLESWYVHVVIDGVIIMNLCYSACVLKKAFLSNQCKETEQNNRMGKTRDLFKKIRDTKRTFHAKMGSIKDRNGMDLTEVLKTR